jgi:hypothetical protein
VTIVGGGLSLRTLDKGWIAHYTALK